MALARTVVLLRGINVSGQKRIVMSEVREVLSQAGIDDVRTYIQSGNIVCSSSLPPEELAEFVTEEIESHWGFVVPAIALRQADLQKVKSANPFAELDLAKVGVAFLDGKTTTAKVTKQLGPLASGQERVQGRGQTVYLYCPDGFGRTKLTNQAIEKRLDCTATSRNWKTLTKLLEMLAES